MHWNPDNKCFVDDLGVPLTKDEIRVMYARLRLHLGADPEELTRWANEALAERSPSMYEKVGPISTDRYY